METTRLRPLTDYADRLGLTLYPHQDEAIIELLGGSHVILTTPTGSGKSLLATAAIHAALSTDRVTFYTAPVKALVSEKFFELVGVFGADNVGMLTGDAAVNAGAPIIACTAEVLANIALREGTAADVGLVVMGRISLLRRARPGLGLAGTAGRTHERPVSADVGDPGRPAPPVRSPATAGRTARCRRGWRRWGRRSAGGRSCPHSSKRLIRFSVDASRAAGGVRARPPADWSRVGSVRTPARRIA